VAKDTALPGARVSTDAPAIGVDTQTPQAVDRTLDTFQRIVQHEKRKADDTAYKDAYFQTIKEKNEILYNPQSGFTNRKGKDSLASIGEYEEAFKKKTDSILEGLANDDQKSAYSRARENIALELSENMNRHGSAELQKYEAEQFEGGLLTMRSDAVLNYQFPGKVAAALKDQEATVVDYAAKNDKPKEWVNARVMDLKSKTHSDVIERMVINGNDIDAKKYFDKALKRGEFDAQDLKRVESIVNEGSTRGKSQRLADSITLEYQDRTSALEAVREATKHDPKLRDVTEDRVEKFYTVRNMEERRLRNQAFMESYKILEQTKDLDAVAGKWTSLSPSQQGALRTLEKQLISGPAKHDDAVYTKYIGMPFEQLARVDEAELIEKVKPNLRDPYFKEIQDRWFLVRNGDKKKANIEAKSAFNDKEMTLNGLKAAKVPGFKTDISLGKLSGEQATIFREFQDKVDTEVASHEAKTGKVPTDEQRKKIINELLVKRVYRDNFFSDDEVPVAVLSEEDRSKAYVPINKVPKSDRMALVNLARSQGLIKPDITDERATQLLRKKIEKAYAAALQGGDRAAIINVMTGDF